MVPARCCLLGAACWVLLAGWLLLAGCYLLGTTCWMLLDLLAGCCQLDAWIMLTGFCLLDAVSLDAASGYCCRYTSYTIYIMSVSPQCRNGKNVLL